jgi:hypothetical protein
MPTHKSREDKALETHRAAAAAVEIERVAREQKTARLRALRLAKETVEKVRGGKR